jgi:predicted nucleic acid-binding protein
LIEVAGAAARRSRDPKEGMLLAAQVASDPRIHWEAVTTSFMNAGYMLAASLFLRGADATYATVADIHKASLITLDAELELRAGGHVQAMSPGKWVAKQSSPSPPP